MIATLLQGKQYECKTNPGTKNIPEEQIGYYFRCDYIPSAPASGNFPDKNDIT